MIIELDWNTFQTRYLIKNRIYVMEKDDSWVLYTNDDIFIIRCLVEKHIDQAENMIFIERYLSGPGIIKVLDIPDEPRDVEEDYEPYVYPEEIYNDT